MDQILVSNAHEALVSREDYAKVQERLNRRAKAAYNYGYKNTFFAGLVKCGKCGYACNHVHHHRQGTEYHHIECNKRKTKECDLLPIREEELKTIMEQTVGSKNKLERIILFDDHIDFFLTDGTVRTHIREYPKGGYCQTPFSRKISCGCCGSSIVRMKNQGRPVWICNSKKTDRNSCVHRYINEEELYEAGKWTVGTAENLEMQIYCKIEKTISYNDRIEFYMKEGRKKVWQRR